MLRRTLKASSARPAQTPLVGCADDASRLISNTVALRQGVCQLQTFSGPGSLVRTSRLHTHWRRCDSESELKLRRECLDWIIPVSEDHLRKTLCAWLAHYNRGRPHSSLGPGLPDPPLNLPVQLQPQRHRFDRASRVAAHSVLNGLHHEYSLLDRAA